MLTLGEAVVNVTANTRPLSQGLQSAERVVRRFTGTANHLLGGIGIGIGTAGIVHGLARAGEEAADLHESLTKVREAFGPDAKAIMAYADEMADKFGLVKQSTMDAASALGLMGLAAGLSSRQAAAMGVELAQLGADMSSFFNIPVETALEKLRAGLAGQREKGNDRPPDGVNQARPGTRQGPRRRDRQGGRGEVRREPEGGDRGAPHR
jgi:hypothetical protein